MADYFKEVHGQLKKIKEYLHLGNVKIDTVVFRLHYVVSVVIFVSYSLITTIDTYAGDPIDCATNHDFDNMDFFDDYCFIHGTKSLKWNKTGEIYDTIGPTADCSEAEGESECITHHPHYMWIPLFTLVQAAISYLPHYLWYYWEDSKMRKLCGNILEKKFYNDNQEGECRETPCDGSQEFVCSSGNKLTEVLAKEYLDSLGDNSFYALKYILAEILCWVTSVLQILLTNEFLNKSFLSYGYMTMADLTLEPTNRVDPMVRTLPIVTMCDLAKFGTGGRQEIIQAICVLPNNIVHQKFYLFLWFWLLFLVSATSLLLLYRLALYTVPAFRSYITNTLWEVMEETEQLTEKRMRRLILLETCYSDWMILALIHSNLTTLNFQNFIDDLSYNWKSNSKKSK